jgi:hypothetical protein
MALCQAGLSTAVDLAQQAGVAVGDGVRGAAAPFALFDGAAATNVLFWAVLLLFCYNLIVLAPRQ